MLFKNFQMNQDTNHIKYGSWQKKKNDIEMYSTHNEGKSVIAERFMGTLKNKIYKYITSVWKHVYIDKLGYIVNKYNNTYSTIKMKPVDVKSNTYLTLTNFEMQNNYENELKFNGVYSANNLSKIKDWTYITNLGEYESIETHWIALYVNAKNIAYFHSFVIQHIPKEKV